MRVWSVEGRLQRTVARAATSDGACPCAAAAAPRTLRPERGAQDVGDGARGEDVGLLRVQALEARLGLLVADDDEGAPILVVDEGHLRGGGERGSGGVERGVGGERGRGGAMGSGSVVDSTAPRKRHVCAGGERRPAAVCATLHGVALGTRRAGTARVPGLTQCMPANGRHNGFLAEPKGWKAWGPIKSRHAMRNAATDKELPASPEQLSRLQRLSAAANRRPALRGCWHALGSLRPARSQSRPDGPAAGFRETAPLSPIHSLLEKASVLGLSFEATATLALLAPATPLQHRIADVRFGTSADKTSSSWVISVQFACSASTRRLGAGSATATAASAKLAVLGVSLHIEEPRRGAHHLCAHVHRRGCERASCFAGRLNKGGISRATPGLLP